MESKALAAHEAMLREKVFFTETKWPQYNLLLDDLKRLNDMLDSGSKVYSYERNVLYGGFSPFSPFFPSHSFFPATYEAYAWEARGAYNKITDERFIRRPSAEPHKIASFDEPDLIMVPNLLHHISEQEEFLKQISNKTSKLIYIFEPTIREIHQAPYDYVRHTPYSLKHWAEQAGLEIIWEHETGGPFTALYYLLDQANQHLPEDIRLDLINELTIKEAIEYDDKYTQNLVRKHTRCPTAFSILATK